MTVLSPFHIHSGVRTPIGIPLLFPPFLQFCGLARCHEDPSYLSKPERYLLRSQSVVVRLTLPALRMPPDKNTYPDTCGMAGITRCHITARLGPRGFFEGSPWQFSLCLSRLHSTTSCRCPHTHIALLSRYPSGRPDLIHVGSSRLRRHARRRMSQAAVSPCHQSQHQGGCHGRDG